MIIFVMKPQRMIRSILFLLICTLSAGALSAQGINKTDEKGEKHGKWIGFFEDGKTKRYEGQFEHGKPVGAFKHFWPKGTVKVIMTFSDGGKKSHAVMHHEEGGKKAAEGDYVGQTKVGLWKYYNLKGKILNEETYRNGKKQGPSKVYFEEGGQVAEEANWENDIQVGPYKAYYDNKQVREETTYLNGVPEGLYTKYYKNGKLLAQGKYANGVKNGGWKYYQENGNLDYQELYDNGRLTRQKKENGKVTLYYDDGRPKSEHNYLGGKKHGDFVEYNDDGAWKEELRRSNESTGQDEYVRFIEGQTISRRGKYVKGELNGKVTVFNEFGQKDRTEYYENGTLLRTE